MHTLFDHLGNIEIIRTLCYNPYVPVNKTPTLEDAVSFEHLLYF